MTRVCNNCGSRQGKFDRLFVGLPKTGRYIFTCRIPLKDAEGRRTSDKTRFEAAQACNHRRDKKYAAAQED